MRRQNEPYQLLRHLRSVSFIAITTGGASCISLIGGMGLEAVQTKILPLVPLLIALPALNSMVGDYAAIIAAHASDPAERQSTKKELARAISKAIWVNIIGVLALSILLAWKRNYLFTNIFLVKFVLFVIGSMVGIIVVMFGITIVLDKILEKQKLNPDDVLIPVVTTVTDIFMLGSIAAAAWFLF